MLQGGSLTLNGQTPLQLGVTKWRTLVTYVPQTRVHPKGTPAEFYFAAQVSLHVLCRIPHNLQPHFQAVRAFTDGLPLQLHMVLGSQMILG